MNVDRRRNLGPANVKPLVFAQSKPPAQHTDSKIFLETGLIQNCSGSSYLENDKTIIITSIYGPHPNFTRSFNDQASLKVSVELSKFLPLDNLKDNRKNITPDKERVVASLESFMLSNFQSLILLQKYPKSSIEIFVQVVALNPAHSLVYTLKNIINGVSVALVDSGLNIRSVASCGYSGAAEHEMAVNFSGQDEILGIWSDFTVFDESFERAIDTCEKDSLQLRKEINGYLLQKATAKQ
ncbi:hypothetical protein KL905_004540 [Ogataea polymorpha]|nr:hypothetical protein KL905_004540 [Ogataea polymorpha]